jgi:hypothetical protein
MHFYHKWTPSTILLLRATHLIERTMKKSTSVQRRKTFRHGDLRNALVAAGLEMALVGGPDAVVLREATRQAVV